jgi:ATP synthase protein I
MQDHDVRIARGAVLVTTLAIPVAALAGWLAAGGGGALGAGLGMALAVAFFGATGVAVWIANRLDPAYVLPVLLGGFLLKMAGVGGGLYLLRDTTAFDRDAFGLAVLGGTLLFLIAEVRIVLRAKIPYLTAPQGDGSVPQGDGR